jgi:hypothetical protein
MQVSRQEAVNVLRRAGMTEAADEIARTMPDPVDFEQLAEFCQAHGISKDQLAERMGGSP